MLEKRFALLAGVASACLGVALPATARAQEPSVAEFEPETERAQSDAGEGRAHALTFALRTGNTGYGGLLGFRRRLRHGIGVGVEVEGVFTPDAVIGGYATEDNVVLAARAPLFFPVHRSRRLTMALTFAPGVYFTRSLTEGPTPRTPSQGLSITADAGVFAYIHASPRLTWVAGIDTPLGVQVDPIVDISKIGTLLVTGPVVPIGDRMSWFATLEAGGVFGSNGDGGKFLVRGTTGLRVVFGTSARQWRAF
ncbi:MAG: hypothetical protein AAF799_23525 [Myxococcota bacterium]